MSLFKSRQGELLWRELPEFLRLFDEPVRLKSQSTNSAGDTVEVETELPGDLRAFLDGFGYQLDRFEKTLAQFYADGFFSKDPIVENAPQMQPWLVPYFADLFGVQLYGPDPQSRLSELSQAIWVARRRGTRIAVDRAAESILQRAVIAVPGLDRAVFTPSVYTPRLTQAEITGEPHAKDALLKHEAIAPDSTYSELYRRHAGMPEGVRDTRHHMRARRTTEFRLNSDSKPVRLPGGGSELVRFMIEDRAGVPCFAYSFEDRALRTPDTRDVRIARQSSRVVSRPDSVVLHVDPPAGIFDPDLPRLNLAPVLSNGTLVAPGGVAAGAKVFYTPGAGSTLVCDVSTGHAGTGLYNLSGLRFDGTLVVNAGCKVHLDDFAIRRIEVRGEASVRLRHGACVDLVAQEAQSHCQLEYVTVTGEAKFLSLDASECIFHDVTFTPGGPDGCLRYSRVVEGNIPKRMTQTNVSQGPVYYLKWPCLPDLTDPAKHVLRMARFGEPGYAVLANHNPEEVAGGAEDGGELGVYHHQFHLARLRAAVRRAEDYTPAGYRVFAQYDQRSAAPLPLGA